MFNGMVLSRGLSLTKIIGGLSRTLQIANQIIPLYQKAKPAIQNARNMLNVLKEINQSPTTVVPTKIVSSTSENIIPEKEKTQALPTFFL